MPRSKQSPAQIEREYQLLCAVNAAAIEAITQYEGELEKHYRTGDGTAAAMQVLAKAVDAWAERNYTK